MRNKIKFGFEVTSDRELDREWQVSGKEVNGSTQIFRASKLMTTSGLTSIPKMPDFRGQKRFGGPVIHQEAFGLSDILTLFNIQNFTVLGGAKSSADMVYSAIKAASLIIKETNITGPGFFLSRKGKGHIRTLLKLVQLDWQLHLHRPL